MTTKKIIITIIIIVLVVAAAWFFWAGPTEEEAAIVPVSDFESESESDLLELEAEERTDDVFFDEIDNELQSL